MTPNQYNLSALRSHTDEVRRLAQAVVSETEPSIEDAFDQFSHFVSAIHEQQKSLQRNVRLVLCWRFLNHFYSRLLLAESGHIADATVCKRSALETLAA
jgi:hypothetical protein